MPIRHRLLLSFAAAALAACGKPPPPPGPPSDMPVQAVVGVARAQPLEETLSLVGNLAPKESIEIRSEIDARVLELGFEEGTPVAAGQVLARFDAAKLDAEVAEARARFALAEQEFERGKTLLSKRTISEAQFDQYRSTLDATRAALRLAQERLADAVISAPFPGLAGERLVSPGQYVDRGQVLGSLVQVDPLEVEFHVPERYVSQVALEQRIALAVATWPDEQFEGRVYFLSPRVDEQSRTLLVKAYVANPEGRLKPGMFANLSLVFRARDAALVIPEAAISYRGDAASIVVMDEQGKAEPRTVQVGMRLAGLAEIVSGIAEGERVVVEGFQKMAPGATIVVAPESERYGVQTAPPPPGPG